MIGRMLVDDDFRTQNAKDIPIDHIQNTELFIIAKAMQGDEFYLTSLYLKHDKKVVTKAIEAVLSYGKQRILEKGTIPDL